MENVRTHAAPGRLTITHACPLEALARTIDAAGYEAVRLPDPWWARFFGSRSGD